MLKNLHGYTVVYLKMGVPVTLYFFGGINVSRGVSLWTTITGFPSSPSRPWSKPYHWRFAVNTSMLSTPKWEKMSILVSVIQPSRFKHSFSGFCWDLEKSRVGVFMRFARWMKGDVVLIQWVKPNLYNLYKHPKLPEIGGKNTIFNWNFLAFALPDIRSAVRLTSRAPQKSFGTRGYNMQHISGQMMASLWPPWNWLDCGESRPNISG